MPRGPRVLDEDTMRERYERFSVKYAMRAGTVDGMIAQEAIPELLRLHLATHNEKLEVTCRRLGIDCPSLRNVMYDRHNTLPVFRAAAMQYLYKELSLVPIKGYAHEDNVEEFLIDTKIRPAIILNSGKES